MLMPIEFPRDFAIADLRKVQIFHLKPWFARSALAVNAIRVPVDLRSVIERFVSQKIEAMLADALSAPHDLIGSLRE